MGTVRRSREVLGGCRRPAHPRQHARGRRAGPVGGAGDIHNDRLRGIIPGRCHPRSRTAGVLLRSFTRYNAPSPPPIPPHGCPRPPRNRTPDAALDTAPDPPALPLRPTHSPAARRLLPPRSRCARQGPAAPAASIMRLTAHDVRFTPVNLMIDWEVGPPDGRSACNAGPGRTSPVGGEPSREILVRNGPRKGEKVPRSPSACRGHRREADIGASPPRRTSPGPAHRPPRGILKGNGPHGGPKSSKISCGEPRGAGAVGALRGKRRGERNGLGLP